MEEEDTSDTASSICNEARAKRLFHACDADGDGFLDSEDLLAVCRELKLDVSLETLLRELGADNNGRVSCESFLRRRVALRPEIEAIRGRSSPRQKQPSSGDNDSIGVTSGTYRLHDSWEFDSGARDLSPEPNRKENQRVPAVSSSGIIDLANKLHLAALASLKGEILDLSSRLHTVTQERDVLEKSLAKSQLEKLRSLTECEERAESQAQRYEERLTELHSVIAELTRKLDRQRNLVIQEESNSEVDGDPDDCEGGDLGDGGGSTTHLPADDSELLDADRTLADADSSSDIDNRAVEAGKNLESLTPTAQSSPPPEQSESRSGDNQQQLQEFQEEIIQRRTENKALQEQLSKAAQTIANLTQERDRVKNKLRDLESSNGIPEDGPVCKVAERVLLKRMDSRHITGPQLAALGVCHSRVAESLVCEVQGAADLQELGREVEAERLGTRLEHARAQNAVLSLSLDESKSQAEKLSLLLGKYESNATALRLALGFSDRAIEAYDVLVALLESELSLILASCRAAGLDTACLSGDAEVGQEGEPNETEATNNRKATEAVARQLLARLDSAVTVDSAPWEEFPADATSLCGHKELPVWTPREERRLREHIGKLKAERSTVRTTVLELESPHVEPISTRHPVSLAEARKMDLETAVLMQEVMAMREDKAELRARVFLLEKERASLELRLSSQDGHQAAQMATIEHLQSQLLEAQQIRQKDCRGDSTTGSPPLHINGDLADALRREVRLKERLQELITTLEKVSKNAEMRHQQSAELVNDLKRANSALVQSIDRTKRKYQSRIRKMEQQMLGMVERHSAQVRGLKQKVYLLEEDGKVHNYLQTNTKSQSSGASETSL